MKPELRHLLRLQRLEKIRAVAKQSAAREAAEAESTLAQLEALASRTGRLIADYAMRADILSAGELQQLSLFRDGLHGVSQSARADALRARASADDKLTLLAEAERRRQAVEDRADAQSQSLAIKGQSPALAARRGFGTALE